MVIFNSYVSHYQRVTPTLADQKNLDLHGQELKTDDGWKPVLLRPILAWLRMHNATIVH